MPNSRQRQHPLNLPPFAWNQPINLQTWVTGGDWKLDLLGIQISVILLSWFLGLQLTVEFLVGTLEIW